MTKNQKIGAAAAVLAVIVGLFLIKVIIEVGVTNDGNKKQQDLIAHYYRTTNVLSDCLVKTKSAVGVAEANTKALDEVLVGAIRGRYEEPTSAQPGSGNPLFSAIVEAYPNLEGLNDRFQDVLTVITGCRSNFRDSQEELQRQVSLFNQWRTGSWTVRTFGGSDYPNDELEIKVEGKPVTGAAALAQMRELVVVEEAQEGRDTGKIANEDPFGNNQ